MKILPRVNFAVDCTNSIAVFALAALFVAPASAQVLSPAEGRTSRALEAVRSNPLELELFLTDMPKGTDLHNHLGRLEVLKTRRRNCYRVRCGLQMDRTEKT